jgi:hypothetical protein
MRTDIMPKVPEKLLFQRLHGIGRKNKSHCDLFSRPYFSRVSSVSSVIVLFWKLK